MDSIYELWAWNRHIEEQPTLREAGPGAWPLRSLGAKLARASGDEGVHSVWVQSGDGAVVWSAGEKYAELHDA